jgi:NodT family efflux transporter outer membrane factor (OMF) lipoprotein
MNAAKTALGSALVAGLLFSCSSYKSLSAPPAMDAAGLVRDGKDSGTDTASVANIPWRSYFADPKLQVLLAEGLDSNSDLRTAIVRIDQAEASLGAARAGQAPAITAVAGANRTQTSTGNHGRDVLGYPSQGATLGFSATWELDLWGRLSSASKAKYAALLGSREYANLVRTQVVADIASDYDKLLALDKEVEVTEQTIALLTKSSQTMAALKQAGSQTEAAVEETNATLYGTQLSLLTLESEVRQEENAICVLLGRKPGPVDRSTLDQQVLPAGFGTGVPVEALSHRPDVRQAQLAVEAAYATTDAARAALYPTLAITSGGASSTFVGFVGAFGDFFSLANLMASLTASLTEPVFDRGALDANVEIAKGAQKESLLAFRQTVLAAGEEVSDILYGYGQSLRKDEFRQKQIASLEKAVDATDQLMSAGQVNYLEVLTAQQGLLAARLSQATDRLERLTYAVDLYKALGGGVR